MSSEEMKDLSREELGEWQDIASAPKDGTEILLLAHGMAIQARYSPGEWSDDTPVSPAEYDGAVWVAFDDAVQFEIEEGAGPDGEDLHGPVTHWMPLPKPPVPPAALGTPKRSPTHDPIP